MKPRAELLLRAAEQAGYLARLALVTHYQMGQLEGADHYYDYGRGSRGWSRNDEEPEPGEMGEIYEEYTSVEHCSRLLLPVLIRKAG